MKIDNMYLELDGKMYAVCPVGENIINISLTTDKSGVVQVVANGELVAGSISIGGTTQQINEDAFEHQLVPPLELN